MQIEVQISLYVYKPEIRAGADLGKIFVYISIQNSDTEIFKIRLKFVNVLNLNNYYTDNYYYCND